METLKKAGIETWGCFIYGFEHDKDDIFEHTLDFALKTGIIVYQSTILTALPGTPLFREVQDNLLYPITPENWGRYNFMQTTLKQHSRHMDNETLSAGYNYAMIKFYKESKILSKLMGSRIPKSFIMRIAKYAIKPLIIWSFTPVPEFNNENK